MREAGAAPAVAGFAIQPAPTGAGRDLQARVLLLAYAFLAAPSLAALASKSWTQEAGSHGPLVLATGLWLFWRRFAPEVPAPRVGMVVPFALVGLGAGLCVLGSVADYVTIQTLGLYLAGVGLLVNRFGVQAVCRGWFPFLYIGFCIPLPAVWLARATLPLKVFVSTAATDLLALAGLPVSREGVTIYVAQYQLLVEDACSGMNSLIGLTAIGLLYVYLRRGASVSRTMVLLGLIIPAAILANILRIIVLILMTYAFGDDVAQGLLHPILGLLLFSAALAFIFAADELLIRGLRRRRPA